MLNYSITFQGSIQMELSRGINAQVLPLMAQAVRAISAVTANNWRERVQHAKLWSGEKDAYMASITVKPTGDFSAEIISDYKYAADIETGRPPYDQKKMLLTSKRVRYVKNGKNAGKRFLIIPIRHNTPGNDALVRSVPTSVHNMAKMLTVSSITGSQIQHNGGTGARVRMVKRATYNWGGSITKGMLKDAGLSSAEQKRYAGMVRFKTDTPGSVKSGGMLTFRVMMEGSSGWVMAAQPGQYLAQKTAAEMQPIATAAFQAAIDATTKKR